MDYAKVQSKVSLKYDSWHKEVLQKFGSALGSEMQTFYGDVSKCRGELEQQSVDAASTSEAVGFITYVQGLKRQTRQWEEQVEVYREGQRLLERQRFQFPTSWLYADNIDGEWGAFSDILQRKDSLIQTQVRLSYMYFCRLLMNFLAVFRSAICKVKSDKRTKLWKIGLWKFSGNGTRANRWM